MFVNLYNQLLRSEYIVRVYIRNICKDTMEIWNNEIWIDYYNGIEIKNILLSSGIKNGKEKSELDYIHKIIEGKNEV